MNNMELCNEIRIYVNKHGNWNCDSNISVVERIMAHFQLPYDTGGGLFYERNKELSILLQYLDDHGTDIDRAWIINQITETHFSQSICDLSPRFIQTYRESEIAYKEDLHMICGCGFRRALEYLVYDYALFCAPEQEEEIQKKNLFERINCYLSSAEDIKDLANAARKLGNNFTHIIDTKDSEYSLENLQAFITLLANDISKLIALDEDIDNNIRIKAKRILEG